MTKQYSIIVVNYNTCLITKNCIQSILKNTNNLEEGELILIDNASTDGSILEFNNFHNKNIKIISNKTNLGFSGGNNVGAKVAVGKYLFFLNSDTLLVNKDLQKNILYLEGNPQIGILAPRLLNSDKSIQDSCLHDQSILNAIKYLLGNKQAIGKFSPAHESKVKYVVGAAILISRTLFISMGGWNEKYFMYYEDLDLCDKVRSKGKQIIYKPDWQIIHLHGQSNTDSGQPSKSYKYLVDSSKKYHGLLKYVLFTLIIKINNKIHA